MYGAVHNATVPVELKNTQYAGLLDPGTYNVSVKMGDKAKKCITGIKIFGNEDLNKDCFEGECIRTLHPVTEPEIEFQFNSDPECMRDMSVYITIVPVTTDGAELDDKMAFQIGLRPLAVSFEDLVRVVANPYFGRISDRALLSSEVGYLLAKAALGKISDWKNEIPPHTNEPVVDAGDTKVQISFNGSDYCYYSPDKEHWEWRLCSSKGWPVFVKDAEDWKDLQKGSCTLPDKSDKSIYNIVENTYGSGAYNNYLLTVKFKDSECEGLSGYGNRAPLVKEKLRLPYLGTYVAGCVTGTALCEAARGLMGDVTVIGGLGRDLIKCSIAPSIVWAITQINIMEDTINEHPGVITSAFFASPFIVRPIAGTATIWRGWETVENPVLKYTVSRNIRTLQRLSEQRQFSDDDIKMLKRIAKTFGMSDEDIAKINKRTAKTYINEIKDLIRNERSVNIRNLLKALPTCEIFGTLTGSITYYAAASAAPWNMIPEYTVNIEKIRSVELINISQKIAVVK